MYHFEITFCLGCGISDKSVVCRSYCDSFNMLHCENNTQYGKGSNDYGQLGVYVDSSQLKGVFKRVFVIVVGYYHSIVVVCIWLLC